METNAERPVATLSQVYDLADMIAPRWRALVLLATFCGLRFGELAGLRKDKLDLLNATVTVVEDLDELDGGVLQRGEVKSAASRRTVVIPAAILADLEMHLSQFAEPTATGFVFVGAAGGRLRRSNFRKVWVAAVREAGPHRGIPVPRSAPYRQHVGRSDGRQHEGTHVADGSCQSSSCVDLPARHARSRRSDCGGIV